MKKHILIMLFLLWLATLIGCTNTNTPEEIVTPENDLPAYTDEFKFLPSHPNMKLKEFIKGEQGVQDYAFYIVSDVEFDKFLVEYEDILIKEGWTVTNDGKPTSLGLEKDEHIAAMALSRTEFGTTLAITAK
mgnify:CR=1 FL=1